MVLRLHPSDWRHSFFIPYLSGGAIRLRLCETLSDHLRRSEWESRLRFAVLCCSRRLYYSRKIRPATIKAFYSRWNRRCAARRKMAGRPWLARFWERIRRTRRRKNSSARNMCCKATGLPIESVRRTTSIRNFFRWENLCSSASRRTKCICGIQKGIKRKGNI